MTDKPDGGPAFPGPSGFLECYEAGKPETVETTQIPKKPFPGMTLRDYACIHLRIPQTGKDWLDEIIRKSQLNEFAGQALVGEIADAMQERADG